MSRNKALDGGLVLLVASLVLIVPGRPFAQDAQDVQQLDLKKPKIFDETYQLINESELNCSFYLYEPGKTLPDIQIVGAERMNERTMRCGPPTPRWPR